jgi:hypothetical protein
MDMQVWEGRLATAGSVAQVMATLGDFLRHQRTERHNAMLPSHCRYIVLTTPADVEWWLKELEAAPPGYGTARMILQSTRAVFSCAWRRLELLGYGTPSKEVAG